MFQGVYIDRVDENGTVVQTMRVPLSYAPRQKFLAKIQGSPESFSQSFQSILPRMSFEITNFGYDSSRKVSSTQQSRIQDKNDPNKKVYQFAPSPWNLNIVLYIYGKNQDDTLQIVEQILPYFNPDYNLNLNALNADLGMVNDLPIILNGATFEDTYEGDLSSARMIIWSLSFTMKMNFYGPSNSGGVIKRANVNYYSNPTMNANVSGYVAEVSPITANVNSDYTILEIFEDF